MWNPFSIFFGGNDDNKSPETKKVKLGKSGKKICCSCPETKKIRDECVVGKGEENCKQEIEAHKECLRAEGFSV